MPFAFPGDRSYTTSWWLRGHSNPFIGRALVYWHCEVADVRTLGRYLRDQQVDTEVYAMMQWRTA